MNRRLALSPILLLLATSFLFVCNSSAQTAPPLDKIQNQEELDRAITALDAALFDSYNRCDLVKFASFIDDNVEFYHDQGGVTLGQAALTDSVKKSICGKVTRELVPGSLKVYPMKGYGALEVGVHRDIRRGDDTLKVSQHRIEGKTAIGVALGPGASRTGGRQCFETETLSV